MQSNLLQFPVQGKDRCGPVGTGNQRNGVFGGEWRSQVAHSGGQRGREFESHLPKHGVLVHADHSQAGSNPATDPLSIANYFLWLHLTGAVTMAAAVYFYNQFIEEMGRGE